MTAGALALEGAAGPVAAPSLKARLRRADRARRGRALLLVAPLLLYVLVVFILPLVMMLTPGDL